MLRLIDSASRSMAFGFTENCSSTAGHAAPTRMLDRISSTVAIAGSWRLRSTAPTKNATAQNTAMHNRISLAGSTALRSVYVAPLNLSLRSENSSMYRSKKYATALSSTNTPATMDRWVRDGPESWPPRPARRMPPNR